MWSSCVRLALSQHGLITLAQAASEGCPPYALGRRLRSGEVERVLPGVYRFIGGAQTWHQQALAACLWGGPGAAASHTTAASLLELKGFPLGAIHICGPKAGSLPTWVTAHRIPTAVRGIVRVGGIPTTPAWRTLADLGSITPAAEVERALDDALRRRLVSLPQLRWALESNGRTRHRGTAVLRGLVAARTPGFVPPESELEAILYRLVDGSDLPPARRQAPLVGRRCDLLFEEAGLVVEVDGWETHGTREAFEDDRARDRAMVRQGLRVLRFTWYDLTRRPEAVVAEIRASLYEIAR